MSEEPKEPVVEPTTEPEPDKFVFDELPPEPKPKPVMKMQGKPVTARDVEALKAQVAASLEPEPEEEEIDEVELRMAKAQYYWELMGLDPFEDADVAADEVWAEVQDFMRGRMAELMGMKKPKKSKIAKKAVLKRIPIKRKLGRPELTKPSPVRAQQSTAGTPAPADSTSTDDTVELETPLVGGGVKRKLYRKFFHVEAQREYWLGYDWSSTGWQGDGNRYIKAVNENGTEYFRVLSQQTLPPGVKVNMPLTSAQIEAQSYAHSASTLRALKKFNPLIANAIELAKQG
jgi:hypothetical protein